MKYWSAPLIIRQPEKHIGKKPVLKCSPLQKPFDLDPVQEELVSAHDQDTLVGAALPTPLLAINTSQQAHQFGWILSFALGLA